MYNNLLLFILGVAVGFVGTFLGIGGGIIIVPVLILLYNLPPNIVVGTSLLIILLSSIVGVALQIKSKNYNLKVAITLSIASMPGALIGAYLVKIIYLPFLKYIISATLLSISIYIFKKSDNKIVENEIHQTKLNFAIAISFLIGIISTIVGIGGGIFQIPQMIYSLNMPIVNAIPTSQLIILLTSLSATIAHFQFQNIDFSIVLPIFLGTIPGNFIALNFSKKISSITLKKIFSILLLIASIIIFLQKS